MANFNQVFGGGTLHPAQQTYLSITSGVDVQLAWPVEQQIGGDVVADIIDVDMTAPGLNLDIPDAQQVATGIQSVFTNVGSNSFTVRDDDNGTIISIAPGEAWVAYLTDNTTAAGTWRTFQLGATVSVASASALSGAGIKAISTTLNQSVPPTLEGAVPFTVVDSDRARAIISTAGAGVANLPDPAVVGSDWFILLRNSGSGDLTVTPAAGVIDDGATLTMAPGESAIILTNGTDYFTVGFGQSTTTIFDFISIAVPGSGDFVLSGVQLDRISYRFTGILTGNRRIVVPNTTQQYWVDNQTTGAFTLSVATLAGSGPTVVQGGRAILYSDSVDVVNATDSQLVIPVSITQGGTGATTVAGAQANLLVPPTSRLVSAGVGLSGGGDLSADRTLDVIQATEGALGGGEIADEAETVAFADDAVIITPAKLGLVLQAKMKPLLTARANTIVLADDPDLAGFVLEPDAEYIVDCMIICDSALGPSTTNDLDWGFDFNGEVGNISQLNGYSIYSQENTFGGGDVFGQDGFSGRVDFSIAPGPIFQLQIVLGFITGAAFVSGTLFDFQWAQGTSEAIATQVRAASFMKVTRIS
jgi:hypothetical protein